MSQDRMESVRNKNSINVEKSSIISNPIIPVNKSVEKVRVVHGANEGYFDLSGKTVGQVKKSLRDVFNISTEAEASIGGKLVGDDFILESGSSLEFCKNAGVKGNDGE